MADDETDDLYDEEFDFVDDEDEEDEEGETEDDTDIGDEAASDEEGGEEEGGEEEGGEEEGGEEEGGEEAPAGEGEEPVDEYGRPEPAPNYVVHIYEHKKFKRTIERPFTPEDAEAFATEFNRTSKNYGRFALAGKNETKPKKALD